MVAVALIVAAGRGERLSTGAAHEGGARPKAFVTLAGKPMLQWSVDALRAVAAVEQIVVALPPGEQAPAGTVGVPGGHVRSASVRAALAAAPPECDAVLVHDAARPLLQAELAQHVLDALRDGTDGAVAASPLADTVKRADRDGVVQSTLERSGLWAVQTPQGFRREALERALAVDDELLAQATDDAWLVERVGGTVRVVSAPPENFKVTTAGDLQRAELLLGARC